ncbi:hypothetical protein I302_108013 [Kwoniella bestiolae CBS 10118]|uniref:FHA domain-containing protein n=1 Tax=Kwoniella bestiolae CBS 10118 TaxID=1296100 RepID=A0A1B9FWX9_9TREE|nr:hypothetical protein I302_07622 [Kwoniella bestiolae CBS 10118]OCF23268.1 hypothetical protein I302_07622 [Kwoniella bestiolae CBS 10118]
MAQMREEDRPGTVESPSDWFISLTESRTSKTTYFTLTQLLASNEGKKEPKALVNGGVILGRKSSTATVKDGQFDSPIISRAHAQLTITPNGHVYITDLVSMHGTSISTPTEITVSPNSPVQVVNGDIILLGRRVYSNGEWYDPLKLTVGFRHHELGKGSGAENKRKQIGKIRSDFAIGKFAGIKDEAKLRKVIESILPPPAERRRKAMIMAMSMDNDAPIAYDGSGRIHTPPFIRAIHQEIIDMNADDSVEFTHEHIHSSRFSNQAGMGLSQDSAIEIMSNRAESPISVRSDTNDSDQENTAPEMVNRSNTYRIPPSVLYLSEEEEDLSLPRGSSEEFDRDVDDSMTDYEDDEVLPQGRPSFRSLSGKVPGSSELYSDPGSPSGVFEDEHESEVDLESDNGEPEVMGVREADNQPRALATPARSSTPRIQDDMGSINPDYHFNSPITIPIISLPLRRDDATDGFDEQEDEVSRHSPPSSPHYGAWYSYSSDDGEEIPEMSLDVNIPKPSSDVPSTLAAVPAQVNNRPSPLIHAEEGDQSNEPHHDDDEQDQLSDVHEHDDAESEEQDEEDFEEDQSMLEEEEQFSEGEGEDEGVEMDEEHCSSEKYSESEDEERSEIMEYSEDGRSSVYDSDGGHSYDEEEDFEDEKDDDEEEEEDGEDEGEDEEEEDEEDEREEEEEGEGSAEDDGFAWTRSEILSHAFAEETDGYLDDEIESSRFKSINAPQLKGETAADTQVDSSQDKLNNQTSIEAYFEPAQAAPAISSVESDPSVTEGITKEVKQEMMSQRNRQAAEKVPDRDQDDDDSGDMSSAANIVEDNEAQDTHVTVNGDPESAYIDNPEPEGEMDPDLLPVVVSLASSETTKRASTPSMSDVSSEGPVTPETSKKRSLPEEFTIVDHGVTSQEDLSNAPHPSTTRPTKRLRKIGTALGYMAVGAAGAFVGLLKYAPP